MSSYNRLSRIFSGKDAKARFLNQVNYEARLKAGKFYDKFKNNKGSILLGTGLAEVKEASQVCFYYF